MNNIISKIKNDIVLQQIAPCLKGIEAYLVGGFIRDIFLGKESYDRDISIVDKHVKKIAKQVAENIHAKLIVLDAERDIFRLMLPDKKNYIDIARAIDNNIEKDILRRDITINAIAFDLNKGEFFDIVNGISDINNKLIRAISEDNFTDDPLRLLRAFRFNSTLGTKGFKIEPKTISIIKKHARLIENPAKERVNTELVKLFEGSNAAQTIELMDNCGMLEMLFPFVADIKKIPPNSHHHLDLFHHSMETVRQIETNIISMPEVAKEIMSTEVYGTAKKIAYLKIAAFMHDIGKPATWTIDEESGRHRFIKHDSVGAELAPEYLKPLKFSKKQTAYIQAMIKHHIYPSNVNINNEKSVLKFLRKLNDNTVDIIMLAMADRLSARGRDITEDIVRDNLEHLNTLLERYFAKLEEIKPLEKLLDGNEIMQILNISPSPKLGEIIDALKSEQEDGNIVTKEAAIEFVKKYSQTCSTTL